MNKTNGSETPRLPVDAELEKQILGCCFDRDTSLLLNVRSVLDAADLHIQDHQRIFGSLCRLADAGGALIWSGVYADMQARKEPITLGYLTDLEAPTYALDKLLARQKDLARRRALILRTYQLLQESADTTLPLEDIAGRLQSSVREIYSGAESVRAESVAEIVSAAGGMDKFMLPAVGILSPWPTLNDVTGGWQRGELVLIAARPSMGKTALALNVIHHAAMHGSAAIFYSFEMARESIVKRLVSLRAGISYRDLDRGELSTSERWAVREALDALYAMPLRIIGASGRTVLSIRVHAERMHHRGMCDLIAVDYIGLIRGADRAENRNRQLGDICRQLKELAAQLNIPVLVLAQLNRGTETRTDKRPMMSDLRDSGELEEHADVVELIHRPGYYKREDESLRKVAEVIIGKNRNGDTPIIPLEFAREFGRFSSPEGEE